MDDKLYTYNEEVTNKYRQKYNISETLGKISRNLNT